MMTMGNVSADGGKRSWIDETTREAYRVTDPAMVALADRLLGTEDPSVEIQLPNPHPDAQWFPKAGLGLFMHWGIHSVVGAQPSWAMIKDYTYAGPVPLYPPERYFALADRFDPQSFHPETWLRTAKAAGFEYAVLTVKHHDGYALWPTHYGNFSTRQYLEARDLVREYVEACRGAGLKVGLYFSPRDWRYPDFPVEPHEFDSSRKGEEPVIGDPQQNQEAGRQFFTYTIGQLHELLTGYGPIDLIWFDGMTDWNGGIPTNTRAVYAWMRSLQPGIVINDRWDKVQNPDTPGEEDDFGDFVTREVHQAESRPDSWWEQCDLWGEGSWGYDPQERIKDAEWVLDHLVRARRWGGNFLANLSPKPDGEMPEGFYTESLNVGKWMAVHGESVVGVSAAPDDACANVPVTCRPDRWFLHVGPEADRSVPLELQAGRPITSVRLMRTGEALLFAEEGDGYRIAAPLGELREVVVVVFE